MTQADVVRRILGCLPEIHLDESELVRTHIEEHSLLAPDERYIAGLDESWSASGTRGVVVTDRRILRHRGERTTDVVALADVERARVRRIWFASVPFLGRGEGLGTGPIVILRFRFWLRGGSRARLRLQQCAGHLRPFVEALLERLPRLEVARTWPGL